MAGEDEDERVKGLVSLAVALVLTGTGSCPDGGTGDEPMRSILRSHPDLRGVMDTAEEHRLQAVVGLVEEGSDGRPTLVQDGFRLDAEYFYPASTVKLFSAVAALERLAELRRETGLPVDSDTPLVFHPLFDDEEREASDPSNLAGGHITVGHEIRKLFLVSDNTAFNRLYELVGPDRLAASLGRAGLERVRIVHRLSEPRTTDQNRRTPRIDLLATGSTHEIPERMAGPPAPVPTIPGLRVGRAYLTGDGELVREPMDFSTKNFAPLVDLQRGLCMVVRPDVDCGGAGFRLSESERALLMGAMSRYPRESENPVYDPIEHPDHGVKFVLPGLRRVVPQERVRVFNKSGQAYGFTTENAWVVDQESGRSFFLAATLYTNEDGILNDDRYEYETVAEPFLADLGEAVARQLWPQLRERR